MKYKIFKNLKIHLASNIMFLIFGFAILLFLVDLFFGPKIVNILYGKGSYLINRMGQIRGGIQRYAKYKIVGFDNNDLKNSIDEKIVELNFITKSKLFKDEEAKDLLNGLDRISKCWIKLKNLTDKNEILEISEKCWRCADSETLRFQKLSESSIESIKRNFIISRIAFLLIFIALMIYIYKKIRVGLEKEIITDFLTGAYNKNYFNLILDHEIELAKRGEVKFSILLIDLDHFKKINDSFGHLVGDFVLSEFVNLVSKDLRRSDFIFRVGGEEFAILLLYTDIDEAKEIAKRIKEIVKSHDFGFPKKVTVSIGVASYKVGEEKLNLIDRADNALYKAKEGGRDKVVVADS